MKTYLVRALALAAVTAAVPANAATYVRDGVIDTSVYANGTVYNNANLTTTSISYDVIPTLAVGDKVTGTVSFANGRVATLYDASSEIFRFWLSASNNQGMSGNWTLNFVGLSGSPVSGTNNYSGAIGGCCTGPTLSGNLTNSSFSFTGFNYSVTMLTANANADATSFFTTKISFADAPSAVPEPATWAMIVIGFGAIGFAMRRRKVALATPFA